MSYDRNPSRINEVVDCSLDTIRHCKPQVECGVVVELDDASTFHFRKDCLDICGDIVKVMSRVYVGVGD